MLLFLCVSFCQAELINYNSLPSVDNTAFNTYFAEDSSGVFNNVVQVPAPAPPPAFQTGLVFPGADWVQSVDPTDPSYFIETFVIPDNFQIFGASLSIQTNGPATVYLNGVAVDAITYSTIVNVINDVHEGVNVLVTPATNDLDGAMIAMTQVQVYDQGGSGQPPTTPTPEPSSMMLVSGGLLLSIGVGMSKKRKS